MILSVSVQVQLVFTQVDFGEYMFRWGRHVHMLRGRAPCDWEGSIRVDM